jgi:hypothetical protein
MLASSLAASLTVPRLAQAQSVAPSEAEQIAVDAYVYGYSLITTEVTRVQGSNVAKTEGMHARPINLETFPAIPLRTFV